MKLLRKILTKHNSNSSKISSSKLPRLNFRREKNQKIDRIPTFSDEKWKKYQKIKAKMKKNFANFAKFHENFDEMKMKSFFCRGDENFLPRFSFEIEKIYCFWVWKIFFTSKGRKLLKIFRKLWNFCRKLSKF